MISTGGVVSERLGGEVSVGLRRRTAATNEEGDEEPGSCAEHLPAVHACCYGEGDGEDDCCD